MTNKRKKTTTSPRATKRNRIQPPSPPENTPKRAQNPPFQNGLEYFQDKITSTEAKALSVIDELLSSQVRLQESSDRRDQVLAAILKPKKPRAQQSPREKEEYIANSEEMGVLNKTISSLEKDIEVLYESLGDCAVVDEIIGAALMQGWENMHSQCQVIR